MARDGRRVRVFTTMDVGRPGYTDYKNRELGTGAPACANARQTHLERARAAIAEGRLSFAADACLDAARASARLGRTREALELAIEALELEPSRFVALALADWVELIGLAFLPIGRQAVERHQTEGRTHDATALLELLVRLDPRCAETRIALGEAYVRCGRFESAASAATAGIDLFERDGNNRDTLLLAQHLVDFHPSHPVGLRALARTHARLGEHDEAEDAVRRLLLIVPDDPTGLELAARMAARTGQRHAAIEYLTQLQACHPTSIVDSILSRAQRWCPEDPAFTHDVARLREQPPVIELKDQDIEPIRIDGPPATLDDEDLQPLDELPGDDE